MYTGHDVSCICISVSNSTTPAVIQIADSADQTQVFTWLKRTPHVLIGSSLNPESGGFVFSSCEEIPNTNGSMVGGIPSCQFMAISC